MGGKTLAYLSAVLLFCLVNIACGDFEVKVDFAYPLVDPCDANNVIRAERTSKPGWWIWAAPPWWDVFYHHDGVWEDGSGIGGSPPATDGIDGTGIHATIDVGYDGDTCLHVYGMECLGAGMEPNLLPDPNTDPICNSEIVSPRHRGAGWKGNDGSVLLTFYGLPHGTYTLKSYHNDLVFLEEVTSCGSFSPLDPRVMPAIVVYGDGVTQIHDEDTNDVNVPIYQETSDANLFARGPSVVKFDFVGSGPVEVEYVTPPIGGQYWGGAAVLNAFVLSLRSDGTAFGPIPSDGAVDVHPDALLAWKPGEWAAQHDVYLGTDCDDVNDADTTSPQYIGNFVYDHNYYQPPEPLVLGQTYCWRVDEVNDACSPYVWKGATWSFTVDDGKAHSPIPEMRAAGVALDTNLSWSAGNFAAWHDVYLGTDADAVASATDPNTLPGRGRRSATTYNPGTLEFGQTYYWRIDEINPGYQDSKGDIWRFTTINYLVIDDMEGYDDGNTVPENPILDTWDDGFDNWTGSELALEYGLNATVHGGLQAMKFHYNNSVGLHKYSEIDANAVDLDNDVGKDWTTAGVKALSLFFCGTPDNDANEQMYVALEDSLVDIAVSEYGRLGEDMNDIKKEEWQQWYMDLEDFNDGGVELTDVNKIRIGFGDRSNPQLGGSGIVYFDDIRLYLPQCIASFVQPEADLNGDCIVDFEDAKIMAFDWLAIDRVEVTAPDANRLLVEYTFDTDYNDTSGNDYHGIPGAAASISDGKLVLDGSYGGYVDIPLGLANPFVGTGNYSIQMTFRSTDGRQILLTSARPLGGGDDEHPLIFYIHKEEDWENWTPVLHILATGGGHDESVVNFNDGLMHCVVLTYDAIGGSAGYYSDGFEDGSWRLRYWMAYINEHVVRIGRSASRALTNEMEASDFVGEIDSLRIYDYVLSESEAMYLATDGTGIRPIISPANLYNEEPPGSRVVNLRDYAELASVWLEKLYWP